VKIHSTGKGFARNFLYHFSDADFLPELKRVRGIDNATVLGNPKYALRFTLDLDRMRLENLSANNVFNGMSDSSMIGAQRVFLETGRTSQTAEYVRIWGMSRHEMPEQYENIILKANPDGEIVRIKDIGEVELVPVYPSYYNIDSDIVGHPSAAIVLKQFPGTNPAVVIEEVKTKLEEIKESSFPPGMTFDVSYEFPASWRLSRNRSQLESR